MGTTSSRKLFLHPYVVLPCVSQLCAQRWPCPPERVVGLCVSSPDRTLTRCSPFPRGTEGVFGSTGFSAWKSDRMLGPLSAQSDPERVLFPLLCFSGECPASASCGYETQLKCALGSASGSRMMLFLNLFSKYGRSGHWAPARAWGVREPQTEVSALVETIPY